MVDIAKDGFYDVPDETEKISHINTSFNVLEMNLSGYYNIFFVKLQEKATSRGGRICFFGQVWYNRRIEAWPRTFIFWREL